MDRTEFETAPLRPYSRKVSRFMSHHMEELVKGGLVKRVKARELECMKLFTVPKKDGTPSNPGLSGGILHYAYGTLLRNKVMILKCVGSDVTPTDVYRSVISTAPLYDTFGKIFQRPPGFFEGSFEPTPSGMRSSSRGIRGIRFPRLWRPSVWRMFPLVIRSTALLSTVNTRNRVTFCVLSTPP
jgi:hypothetical protein